MVKLLESKLDDKDVIENGFESVKIGDEVKFPIYKMTDIPEIDDMMRVGPLTGTCIDRDEEYVTMKVEWNLYANKSINESLPSGRSESEFLDKYFGRVDLSNKARYKYYKYRGKEFAYDMDNSVVIMLFRDDDEIAEIGNKAPYRELDSVGLSYDHWKNKESRNEYLDEYIYDSDSYMSDLADDFVKNELPMYKKDESVTPSDIKNAKSGSSFMDDRATLTVNGREYVKIGKNKWQYNPKQSHALGGIYTDAEIMAIINNAGNIDANITLNEDDTEEVDVTDEVIVDEPSDDIEELSINEYIISYQYTPDEDNSMTGELMIMATSSDEAEEEFYKYHNDDYTILEVTRHDIDLNSPNTFDNSDEVIADMEVEASGTSADDIDPNQTGVVEPAGNDANVTMTNDTVTVEKDTDNKEESLDNLNESDDCADNECDELDCGDEDYRSDNADEDSEILVELSEDGSEFPEWKYTEDEIFYVAYSLMNDGYCEGWEAADIQDELLYADHDTVGDAPYIFTMIEEDVSDDEDELDESIELDESDCIDDPADDEELVAKIDE